MFKPLLTMEESRTRGNYRKKVPRAQKNSFLLPRDAFHETKLKFPFHFWKHVEDPYLPLSRRQVARPIGKAGHLQCRRAKDKGPNFPNFRCLKKNGHWKEPESLQQVCKYQTDHLLKEQVTPILNFPPPITERSRRTRLTSCHPLVLGSSSQPLEWMSIFFFQLLWMFNIILH